MKGWKFFLQPRRGVAAALAVFLVAGLCFASSPFLFAQQTEDYVAELQKVEAQVKQVVKQNMPACVSLACRSEPSAGSGVVVTEDGLILTAGHVMVGDGNYDVLFPDGRTARAVALGKNLSIDAGMLQIVEPGPWPYVKIGKSRSLNVGEWVVSMGHSGGFELGRRPPVRTGRVLEFNETQMVTDAVLIGGDSGGPLFGLDGKLVGIHSSIGDSVAENRHVLMELFGESYERMKRGEQWGELPMLNDENDGTKPPKMGVVVDLKSGTVKEVKKNSPAWDAGIESGDIVTFFDGTKLDDGNHLIRLVKEKISGDVVIMKVQRGDRVLDFEVRLR